MTMKVEATQIEVYGCLTCDGETIACWEFLGSSGDVFRLCGACAAAFELGMENPGAKISELCEVDQEDYAP
jgi:hypothetical protein